MSYDSGEITDRERKASQNQTAISQRNVRDVQNQLARQLANYDFADRQNAILGNKQRAQNSRKTSADRFEAQRDLQAATLGLLGSMGTAMNGSSTGNLMSMLRQRNDKENNTYWAQLQSNQDQVENAFDESINQNRVARRDAMQSAEKAIRDIETEWGAAMNNINPNLYAGVSNIGGDTSYSSNTAWSDQLGKAQQNNAKMSGYLIPDATLSQPGATTIGNRSRINTQSADYNRLGNDYFSQLMSRFSGR